MKIRSGFVSNSSSASFVIAIRKDCTLEEFRNYYLKDVESYVADYKKEIEEVEDIPMDETIIDYIINKFYYGLMNEKYGRVDLGNWIATSLEGGTETNLLGMFLYNTGSKNEEKLKTASYA